MQNYMSHIEERMNIIQELKKLLLLLQPKQKIEDAEIEVIGKTKIFVILKIESANNLKDIEKQMKELWGFNIHDLKKYGKIISEGVFGNYTLGVIFE